MSKSWNNIFLENLIVAQLVTTFLAFYGTRRTLSCTQECQTHPSPPPDESNQLSTYYVTLMLLSTPNSSKWPLPFGLTV